MNINNIWHLWPQTCWDVLYLASIYAKIMNLWCFYGAFHHFWSLKAPGDHPFSLYGHYMSILYNILKECLSHGFETTTFSFWGELSILSTLMSFQNCMHFFLLLEHTLFWRMIVPNNFPLHGQKRHFSKFTPLCSAEVRKSHRFAMTQAWLDILISFLGDLSF